MNLSENQYDVIVIGAGPAGLTAGIYLSRAKIKTLILNSGIAGGQIVLTHKVANYPAFEDISGFELAQRMLKQAQSFGCKVRNNINITHLDLTSDVKSIEINSKETYTAKAVVVATGGRARELGASGEKKLIGRGISHCATCDGEFFTDKEIIVVGGGNSALEEAVSLTQFAKKVTIVHQFDHFQAFESAIREAKEHPKIDFLMESVIAEFYGDDGLTGVKIKNLKTGETQERTIEGVFVFIGYVPRSEFLNGIVEVNKWGEIITDERLATNVPGVFAAGDVRQKKIRQITTAVSDGTIAGLSAGEYIQGK